MPHSVLIQLLLIVCSTILLGAAIYLLSFYKRLFRGIRSLWLRRNLVVLIIALLIMTALVGAQSPGIMAKVGKGFWGIILKELGQSAIIVFFVFNTVWLISSIPLIKRMSFIRHHAVVILSIVVSAVLVYSAINYIDNGMKFANLHALLMYAYINSIATGFIYTAVNYVELERKRKLNEKELEVTRLTALKTKAELEALHSKVNPHFLYNALNSIADLAITDGRKARKMTIALADLFRFSINYSNNNYSTIKDEVEMAEVYLQIEKIRFEDQLNYTVNVDEELNHYLVPRFILQPIVENAVKHGLKATGQMTQIFLEVKRKEDGMEITVADNGPDFPETLNPGYGFKSMFDKLDLLFADEYELRYGNQPRKQISIFLKKLMKNEPVIQDNIN
jgi:two-component system, LytTR family, sensor kinase